MHTSDVISNKINDNPNDDPSIKGSFSWAVVGKSCIPCISKTDGSKYVSVRIAESKVLAHFLHRLNIEVLNCVSVKSFSITEAETKLLNEINSRHCEFTFGKETFSMDSDFIVKLDDLIEFYSFMETCYNKLLLQTPACNENNKCGFVRINDDSVVPYAVKNNQKYVPLFYFEGETESLKTKAINLENWDLAYLKFCCKVQGIKNELFASEQCLVTSLEDVKSYFPEGTKFDDYWPSKVVEIQTTVKNDMNGNHSWVQTPHIPNSSVPISSSSHKTLPSLSKQLQHNNQRINASTVISNTNSQAFQQGGTTWPSNLIGNSATAVKSGTYQVAQVPQSIIQSRLTQKPNTTVSAQPINSNANLTSRSYVNQNTKHPFQYYSNTAISTPIATGTIQSAPPPLVRVSTANSTSNYASSDSFSHIYSNTLPSLYSMSSQHHTNNTNSLQTNKVRNNSQNSITAQRFPPALTPINGTSNIISSNNVLVTNLPNNNAVIANNRNQTDNCNPSGEEIIDLSSPPHSPLNHVNASPKNSIPNNNVTYNKSGSYSNFPSLIRISEASKVMSHLPPHKVQTMQLKDKSVLTINLKPYVYSDYVMTLSDIVLNYFPRVDLNGMRNVLQNVFKVNLYRGNSIQMQLLKDNQKCNSLDEEVPLILVSDFDRFYLQLAYVESTMNPEKNTEREAKRQKIS